MIKAISLDLDGTLWEVMPTIRRAEARLHDWLAEHYPRIPARYSIDELRALNAVLAEQDERLNHDFSLRRTTGLSLAAQRCGYADETPRNAVGEQAFRVFLDARQEVELFASVIPTLERLAEHLPIIALTNGNADVHRIGIGQFFEFSLSPADVPYQKPHPVMFEQAAERLGINTSEILHVGDEPGSDIAGARAAGCRSVWFNPGQRANDTNHEADIEIGCLSELPGVVEALTGAAEPG